jgi:hypothetical protein
MSESGAGRLAVAPNSMVVASGTPSKENDANPDQEREPPPLMCVDG